MSEHHARVVSADGPPRELCGRPAAGHWPTSPWRPRRLAIFPPPICRSALRRCAPRPASPQAGGFRQLAANLRRAAELTAVPNAELLRMYEMLRPGRSTYAELQELAARLETRVRRRRDRRFRARGRRGLPGAQAAAPAVTTLVAQIAPQRSTQYSALAAFLAPIELQLSPIGRELTSLEAADAGRASVSALRTACRTRRPPTGRVGITRHARRLLSLL